jgi:mono/diheme cytochrome c family protein/plastocyanin
MRKEWIARFIAVFLVASAVLIPLVAWRSHVNNLVIHARMAEKGGWTPENLTAEVGKPLRILLTSDDVMHGFAIGQSDLPPVDVKPGEITEVMVTFDRPGKYTFYCTRWCSLNHWRMRGTIEVTGTSSTPEAPKPPLYVALGMDIDAAHQADILPEQMPSAVRGAQLGAMIPAKFQTRDEYLTHSPVELWRTLRADTGLKRLTDQDIWDMVAVIWRSSTTPQALQAGKQLYTANCAACHGETGAGDGVFAAQLDQSSMSGHGSMQDGEMTTRPAAFTDPIQMLSVSPAHLQGKVLRGGMGTGMPYWGPIFTDEQTWALVSYLWTFQFNLEEGP